MLDPGKRKCHRCYDEQDRQGIPIPNCSNPDGDGPCPYPTLLGDLMPENARAWELWSRYPEQIVKIDVGLSGAMYTLNLASFAILCREVGVSDVMGLYAKIRAIFDEWRRIQDAADGKKTRRSLERARSVRRGA